MRKIHPTACLLLFCSLALQAENYQWPVLDSNSTQISSTFGESRNDHFHTGLDIPGEGIKVRPVEDARLVWVKHASRFSNELPFGGGQTIILKHNNSSSGYMHLQTINRKILIQETISRKTILGRSGKTGHSGGAHLHFYIYSDKKNAYINPLLVLPDLHNKDIKAPLDKKYSFLIDNKLVNFNPQKKISLSRDFPLYMQLSDSGSKNENWGIYQLQVKSGHNYTDITQIKFDTIGLVNHRWRLNNKLSFEQVYFQNHYFIAKNLIKYPNLTISTKGIKGPSLNKKIMLNIN